MHQSAMGYGKHFFKIYCTGPFHENFTIVDIGSQDVNGSLREVCPSGVRYIGLDFVEGKGVDIVIDDPYRLPLEDASADIVVSSSCFEHSEFFWLVFLEVMRILKDDGVFYLSAPSNGVFHRYPVDCWRFYPDSGLALVNWAKRHGFNPVLLESFIGARSDEDVWHDYVAVFIKDENHFKKYTQRILHSLPEFFEGYVDGQSLAGNIISDNPDLLLIKDVKSQIVSFNQAVIERDERLAQLAQEIEARETREIGLTKQLEVMRLAFAQKDVDRQTELEIIYRSTSWRLTWPVRLVGAKFRKVRRGLVAYRHARTNYSLKEIVLRAYAIYRNDGLSGLIKRAKLQATIADYMASSSRARSRSAQQLDRDLSTALLAPARDAINSIDLSDHDILSLDIFDTAILRLVSQPTDVFRHIEEQIPNPGFCNWRVQRERDERERRHPAREISISQIYEEDSLRIDMEFKIEQATCVANPEIYELYRRALRQGKSVIFVSDMYLNRAQIELLLDQTGYTKRDQVYVSADDQLLKGDGSRFQALRAQYEGKSLLHIGDNRVSDVDRALGAGFAAIHYQLPDSFYQNDRLLSGMYPTLKDNKSLSVSTLLASYQYWKLGISRTSQISIWREVGFLFAGPLLFGFIRHLKAYLDEHKGKVGNVYFIARDGDIMKQVFDYLYANSDYRVCYLTLSRRSATFPLFAMKSSAAIDRILSVYTHCEGNMSVDNLMRRLGYDEVGEMRDFLQTVAKKNGGFIAKSDIMDAFRRYRDDLAALARVEGEALQRYLDEIGFHDGAPLLVDVGWNGTIQDCLGIFCEDGSSTSHIYGMYLGVWENVQNIDRKHGYLFQGDALNGRFGTYIDFIEFLTSSPKLGVKCLKLGAEGSIQPEYFDAPDEEKARNDAAREIQRGVMEYCALVKDREILQNHIPSPDNIFDLFSVLKANQSSVVLAAFNTLRHQRTPNGEYLHPIFNFNV